MNSIVLIENGKAYIKSTAVLRICRNLHGMWRFLYLFTILPKRVLDLFYDIIAKNRYRWFGKKTHCKIYPEEIRKRFLVD